MSGIPLVLLDRDGVINEDRPDSVRAASELILLPGAVSAIARLNEAGIRVAVVTNQSIVGKGIITQAELDNIHTHMHALLADKGAKVDAMYVCTDHPDQATNRRKPGDGMLCEALKDFDAEAGQTPFIGDAVRDLQAAASAGCPRYLVRTGKGADTYAAGLPETVLPVKVVNDLAEAVEHILTHVFVQ